MSLLLSGAAYADPGDPPVIPGFGEIRPAQDVANLPDPALRYKVAFEVTRAASDSSQVNPALDRVARFVNLLGASGIRPAPGDIVIVVHGAATPALMGDTAYRERFSRANPNTPLIAALVKAGVSVHVCSYALTNAKIEHPAVANGVTIDLAAMVTLSTLQLKGWALLPG